MGIEGLENLTDGDSPNVTNNVPEGTEPEPVTDDVPDEVADSGLPVEGDSDEDPTPDAVTTHEEDDDPLSNVGDEVSDE